MPVRPVMKQVRVEMAGAGGSSGAGGVVRDVDALKGVRSIVLKPSESLDESRFTRIAGADFNDVGLGLEGLLASLASMGFQALQPRGRHRHCQSDNKEPFVLFVPQITACSEQREKLVAAERRQVDGRFMKITELKNMVLSRSYQLHDRKSGSAIPKKSVSRYQLFIYGRLCRPWLLC